jgi:hypothetical protein
VPRGARGQRGLVPEKRVGQLIYRLVCRNGLIASDHALRKTHVGRALTTEAESTQAFRDDTLAADDRAFFLKVRDVVEAAVPEATFRQVAQKLQETRDIRLTGEPVGVGRGAGQPLHSQRHRACRRAAAPHRRWRPERLRPGQRAQQCDVDAPRCWMGGQGTVP